MMRASRPKATSLRAQWWALELASMATRQPAGSLRTPCNEFIAWQGSVGHQLARCIDAVNLDDAFCQIGTNSCNLGSKDFSFKRFQID